jgi:uncharacterized protein YjiS (DUF1127 family)
MEQARGYAILEVLWAMVAAAAARVYAALRAATEARGRAAAARELERLSDHTLRDIGLHRSQIGVALREQRPWS